MSSDWKDVKISEICTFLYGKNLPSEIRSTAGIIPVYGSSGITGYHNEACVNEPGIIIGRKGTVGAINYSSKPFWPIDTTFYIPSSSVENIKYLYYLFKSIDFKNLGSDSAVPGLNRNAAHSLKIKIPPVSEQKAIANLLSSLDDKIELNRQTCKTLEDIASTLFKSWFIDFDPVKAKAAGREPEGLSPKIAELFPDTFVDSPLGKIPSGWKEGQVSDLAEVVSGKRPSLKYDNESAIANIPIYGSGGIMGYTDHCLHNNEILLTGRVGTLGQIFKISRPCWPSDNTLVILPIDCASSFLYLYFKTIDLKILNRGSTQPLLTQSDLKKLKTITPNINLLYYFQKMTSDLFSKVNALEDSTHCLIGLRDLLIPKLISGEIQL